MLAPINMRRTFNKGTISRKRALNGTDLSLGDSDLITVIGDNSAGKSTILSMITGMYPIDSGKIEIDGVNISRQPEYKQVKYIGHMFQDPMKGTAADMEVQKNMALASRRGQRYGLGWGAHASEKDYYRDILTRLGFRFQIRMISKVRLLPGGRCQTPTPLMIILQKPRLLLLDEHTAVLDPQTAKKVLDPTNEMVTGQKFTTLMVTHSMKDVIQIGNRLIVMNDGHIIYDISSGAKKNPTVDDLSKKFSEAGGDEPANDRMTFSKQLLTKFKKYLTFSHTVL